MCGSNQIASEVMLRIPVVFLMLGTSHSVQENALPGTNVSVAHIKGLDTQHLQRTHLRVKEARQAMVKIGTHPQTFREWSPSSKPRATLLALSQRLQVLGANMQRGRARGCGDSFGTLDDQTTVVDLDTTEGCKADDRKPFVHFAGGDAGSCIQPAPPAGCHRYVVVHYSECDLTEAAQMLDTQNTSGKFNEKGELISCKEKVEDGKSTVYIFGAPDVEEDCKKEDACDSVHGAKPAVSATEVGASEPPEELEELPKVPLHGVGTLRLPPPMHTPNKAPEAPAAKPASGGEASQESNAWTAVALQSVVTLMMVLQIVTL